MAGGRAMQRGLLGGWEEESLSQVGVKTEMMVIPADQGSDLFFCDFIGIFSSDQFSQGIFSFTSKGNINQLLSKAWHRTATQDGYEHASRNCISKPGPQNLLSPMCLATETKPKVYRGGENQHYI